MNKKIINFYLIISIILPLLAILIWWFGPSLVSEWQLHKAPYTKGWYAIYLDNGQVLYGQIKGASGKTLKMTNIYYVQSVTVADKTTNNLIKRGTQEISAPLNYLLLNREHILYLEEVGANSQIMSVIKGGK